MLGYVGRNDLHIVPIARFPNGPVESSGELHWNIHALFESVVEGVASAVRQESALVSVGVDSWAVDYGLIVDGELKGEPFHYRDSRGDRGFDSVRESIGAVELYDATGIQQLPINTIYQLVDDARAGRLETVDEFLLIPDLFTYLLTGIRQAERTNASTTGLLSARTGAWDFEIANKVALPRRIFPGLVDPGTEAGTLLPAMAKRIGSTSLEATTVGSHDTASAVVAVPSTRRDFAYISCGTWALVGVELDAPILSEASRLANFTNELGVDGRIRYLRNEMGLWILTETVRGWDDADLVDLIAAASTAPPARVLFDVDDPRFRSPGDMPARIAEWFTENDETPPKGRVATVRTILDSLAEAYARTIREVVRLTGHEVAAIHLLGGGSQNELLCQLIADRSGLPVFAGPMEATAIGNVLVQARARGLVPGSLESLRRLVEMAFPPKSFTPSSSR
jgi:rhamnulokinase